MITDAHPDGPVPQAPPLASEALSTVLHRLVGQQALTGEQADQVWSGWAAELAVHPDAAPTRQAGVGSRAAEAGAYLGGAVVLAAIGTLLASADLGAIAGGALLLVLAAVLVGLGAVLPVTRPTLDRLRGVLWAVAVAAVAGGTAALVSPAELTDATSIAVVSGASLVPALALLVVRRAGLQVAAAVLSLHGLLAAATMAADLGLGTSVLAHLGLSLLVVLAGATKLLPVGPALSLGTAGALVACQVGGSADHGLAFLALGVAVAAAGFGLGATRSGPDEGQAPLIVLGTAGIAVLVPQLLFELLAGVVAAALGLLVVGGVVVAGSVLVLRRTSHHDHQG